MGTNVKPYFLISFSVIAGDLKLGAGVNAHLKDPNWKRIDTSFDKRL